MTDYLFDCNLVLALVPPKVGGLGGLLNRFCVSPDGITWV